MEEKSNFVRKITPTPSRDTQNYRIPCSKCNKHLTKRVAAGNKEKRPETNFLPFPSDNLQIYILNVDKENKISAMIMLKLYLPIPFRYGMGKYWSIIQGTKDHLPASKVVTWSTLPWLRRCFSCLIYLCRYIPKRWRAQTRVRNVFTSSWDKRPFAGWSHILSSLHATKNNFLMCSYIISTFIQKHCLRATTWGSAVQETLFWLSTGIRHDYLVVSIFTSADPCKRWPATSVGM